MKLTYEKLAGMIDHTLLKPNASCPAIDKLCSEAKENKFKSVCVNPFRVKRAKNLLTNTDVLVASVVGFPLGASKKETKLLEAKQAVEEGADELDMVANMGALKDEDIETYKKDIEAVVSLGKTTKVIIETCFLSQEEIVTASKLCVEAGAHFVKTSTGFGTSGAKTSDIRVIRNAIGNNTRIKASGGIKDFNTALEMIQAGADRIGTSSGVDIMKGFHEVEI